MQTRNGRHIGSMAVQAWRLVRCPSGSWLCAICAACVVWTIAGCSDSGVVSKKQNEGGGDGLKVKSTDDIGEFDPQEGRQVVDSRVVITNPITGPLEAYEPLKQQISELAITQAVQLFHATEGRYPKDHEEFMSRVIQQNGIRLPQLSPDKRYEYDVQNHCLMVVVVTPPKN